MRTRKAQTFPPVVAIPAGGDLTLLPQPRQRLTTWPMSQMTVVTILHPSDQPAMDLTIEIPEMHAR